MDFDYWLIKLRDAQSEGMLKDLCKGILTAESSGHLTRDEVKRLSIVYEIALRAIVWKEEAFTNVGENYTT